MRVRLLAIHQGGGLGGAPISLVKLLAALDRSEFETRAVFTESGPAVDYARGLDLTADVVPTGGAFFYSAHARLGPRSIAHFVRTFPSAVRAAQAFLRAARPDVVHLNTSVLLAWAVAARRERLRVVWVVREVLGPNPRLGQWHANFILRHANRVVAISDAVAACFARPVDRVHNAVDLSEFRLDVLDEAPAVRAELGIAAERRIVMAIGSVQRPKGHWLLLDAFARLPTDTQLVLATGGVEPSYAQSMRGRVKRALGVPLDNLDALLRLARARSLADRITVTGFRTDIARVLTVADVLVFPSLQPEGFGRPIIEAMALARPVVATNVGPSAELLGSEAGRLVPPDAPALAEAIREVLGSADLRERMGRSGRARVEACFSLERQVTDMVTIYRQVSKPVG